MNCCCAHLCAEACFCSGTKQSGLKPLPRLPGERRICGSCKATRVPGQSPGGTECTKTRSFLCSTCLLYLCLPISFSFSGLQKNPDPGLANMALPHLASAHLSSHSPFHSPCQHSVLLSHSLFPILTMPLFCLWAPLLLALSFPTLFSTQKTPVYPSKLIQIFCLLEVSL